MASIQLTSLDEISEVFSAEGVDNHLEIENQFESNKVLNKIINRATERCLLYLRSQYREEDLETSEWVREQATYIACYLLSVRKGNPSLYTELYAQALMDLEQVRDGHLDAGIPAKARAVVQTPVMDSRHFQPKRINPLASTRVLPGQKLPRYPLDLYDRS